MSAKLLTKTKVCKAFAEDKSSQSFCGDLVLGWAVLQKLVFNH